MNESLFIEFVKSIWPKLSLFIKEKENNGKKRTYLHKTMLTRVYSADQKWEGTSANTTYVSADMVAMDSPLPPKMRDSIASSSGKLPKVGMKKVLRETQINTINVMRALLSGMSDSGQAKAQKQRILSKLLDDPLACSIGIDEKNEANFLTALSEGMVLVEDADNVGTALRVKFGYLPENSFGVTVKGAVSGDDIKRVISKADADGNSIAVIALALSTYNLIRNSQWAKELVANYKGQTFDDSTKLPVPSASVFDEAFADDNGGIKFLKIDRTIISEKNGKRNPYKPWNANKLIYLTTEDVGSLVWGTLAEDTNRVAGVEYSVVDEFKLISKYSKTDPLQEFTNGQALVLPVIENVDQVYSQDLTEAEEVDETAEATDTTDVKITVWGAAYNKPDFIAELRIISGERVAANISDAKLIEKVNALSDEQEEDLKAAVEPHKA